MKLRQRYKAARRNASAQSYSCTVLIRDLLPSLIKCLREGDDDVAKSAAFIITELKHGEPDITLAILIDATKHPSPRVRAQVIECIATFEAGAVSAVPSLVQFLADPDPRIRTEATNALRIISPEILTKPKPQ
jgi:HEAT repeat protein